MKYKKVGHWSSIFVNGLIEDHCCDMSLYDPPDVNIESNCSNINQIEKDYIINNKKGCKYALNINSVEKNNTIFNSFKKISVLALSTILFSTSLTACNKDPNQPTKPTPPTPPAVVSVEVEDVITEAIGSFNFSEEYQLVYNGVAINNIADFERIKNIEVEQGQSGSKITIEAETTNGDVSYSASNVQGNVVEHQNRGTKTQSQNIDALRAELNYNEGDKVEQGSSAESAIESYVESEIAEFKATSNAISGAEFTNDNPTIDPPVVDPPVIDPPVDPEPGVDPEPPQEVTYVVAGDVVNQILGDINVEADIQAVAEAIVSTSAPASYEIDHILAVDDNTYYLDMKNNSNSKNYIMGLKINNSKTQYQTFYDYVENNEEAINSILTSKSLNTSSQVEENSTAHNELISALTSLKNAYNSQKTALSSTAKADISILNIFTPSTLTSQEMTNLGIEDMNEFSYALKENTKGSGYDKVTGFEKEDVVGTYITSAGDVNNINEKSAFNVLTITKKGIHTNTIYVTVDNKNQTLNKFLQDSADVDITTETIIKSSFGEKTIVYNTDGTRVA